MVIALRHSLYQVSQPTRGILNSWFVATWCLSKLWSGLQGIAAHQCATVLEADCNLCFSVLCPYRWWYSMGVQGGRYHEDLFQLTSSHGRQCSMQAQTCESRQNRGGAGQQLPLVSLSSCSGSAWVFKCLFPPDFRNKHQFNILHPYNPYNLHKIRLLLLHHCNCQDQSNQSITRAACFTFIEPSILNPLECCIRKTSSRPRAQVTSPIAQDQEPDADAEKEQNKKKRKAKSKAKAKAKATGETHDDVCETTTDGRATLLIDDMVHAAIRIRVSLLSVVKLLTFLKLWKGCRWLKLVIFFLGKLVDTVDTSWYSKYWIVLDVMRAMVVVLIALTYEVLCRKAISQLHFRWNMCFKMSLKEITLLTPSRQRTWMHWNLFSKEALTLMIALSKFGQRSVFGSNKNWLGDMHSECDLQTQTTSG